MEGRASFSLLSLFQIVVNAGLTDLSGKKGHGAERRNGKTLPESINRGRIED